MDMAIQIQGAALFLIVGSSCLLPDDESVTINPECQDPLLSLPGELTVTQGIAGMIVGPQSVEQEQGRCLLRASASQRLSLWKTEAKVVGREQMLGVVDANRVLIDTVFYERYEFSLAPGHYVFCHTDPVGGPVLGMDCQPLEVVSGRFGAVNFEVPAELGRATSHALNGTTGAAIEVVSFRLPYR